MVKMLPIRFKPYSINQSINQSIILTCTNRINRVYRYCFTVNVPPTITLASAVLAYHHPMKLMDIYNYTTDATTIGTGTGSMESASIWANFERFNKIRGTISADFGLESQMSVRPSYVTGAEIGVARARMEWQLEKLIGRYENTASQWIKNGYGRGKNVTLKSQHFQ